MNSELKFSVRNSGPGVVGVCAHGNMNWTDQGRVCVCVFIDFCLLIYTKVSVYFSTCTNKGPNSERHQAPVRQKGKVPVPEECECVCVCVCGWKNPNNICIIRRIDPEQDQLLRPWTVRGKIAFPCLGRKYIWTLGAASICSGLCPSKRLG